MPSVNLIPKDLMLRRIRRRRLRMWGFCASVSVVMALIPVGRELSAVYQLNSQRQTMDTVSEELARSRRERDASIRKLSLLRKEISRSERLRYKRSWASLISLIARELPEGAWLVSLATDPERPNIKSTSLSPTKPRIVGSSAPGEDGRQDYSGLVGVGAPNRMVIEGQALGIEEIFVFVSAVHDLGVFENAILKTVSEGEVEGLPINHFRMECTW